MTSEVCNQTTNSLRCIFDRFPNLEARRAEDGKIHQLLGVLEKYQNLNPQEEVSDDPLNQTQEELLSLAFINLEKIASNPSPENQVRWNEAVFSLTTIFTVAPKGSPMFVAALVVYGEVIELTDKMVDIQAVGRSLISAGFPVDIYESNGDCIIFISDICKMIQEILIRSGLKAGVFQNDSKSIEVVHLE